MNDEEYAEQRRLLKKVILHPPPMLLLEGQAAIDAIQQTESAERTIEQVKMDLHRYQERHPSWKGKP